MFNLWIRFLGKLANQVHAVGVNTHMSVSGGNKALPSWAGFVFAISYNLNK